MRWWPRTIRLQMLLGLVLIEALSIALFALVLARVEGREIHQRIEQRLAHQSTSLALQARAAYEQERPELVAPSVNMMGDSPSVSLAKITDPRGSVLYVSNGDPSRFALDREEKAQLARIHLDEPIVFSNGGALMEGVKPIYTGSVLRGFAWIQTDPIWDREQLRTILRGTLLFGIIWIGASALLMLGMTRAISQPLAILHRGTRALMKSPQESVNFPLPVTVNNEFGDLIEAFNRMVASIEEQRSGLNDTLSLLDSMLANAPIGLVFFDRRRRIVRVNEVFAGMAGVRLSRHLGRTLPEILPETIARRIEQAVQQVIETEKPVHNVELTGETGKLNWPWTWLVTAYPVRTATQQVRWVGVIVLDASERKRGEEALRRTEKLAATGRLAASIAHEINNPLEAITNLLFLMRSSCALNEMAMGLLTTAEQEVRRMSEITQQTLRFYRQSTLPGRATMSDLLDSVLSLYQPRLNTLGIEVQRRYDTEMDLFCFAGEVRQVIANMVGNAIDATVGGGRLVVRARRSRSWKDPGLEGVRFTVADTGNGMELEVKERMFEAFFTTKGITGTGLGLWVSHEIIVKHHGMVHVRSRPASAGAPSGSVFQIFFPDNQQLAVAVAEEAVVLP